MKDSKFQSVFDKCYDVVVFGSGYAGFAAACRCADSGKRVLLTDQIPTLLKESSYFFNSLAREDEAGSPEFGSFLRLLEERRWCSGVFLDIAGAEIVATAELCGKGVDVLYYATPVSLDLEDGIIASVTMATKRGMQAIRSKAWLDCTENATLALKIQPGLRADARPSSHRLFTYYRNLGWDSSTFRRGTEIFRRGQNFARILGMQDPKTVCVETTVPGASWKISDLFGSLKSFKEFLGADFDSCSLSGTGFEAYPIYDSRKIKCRELGDAANFAAASPALSPEPANSLGGRFALGIKGADKILGLRKLPSETALRSRKTASRYSVREMDFDVCVAGAGTGGAVAAISAGRRNSRTVCAELYDFPGGIGTGGGIYSYYYGACGGIQEEIDDRVEKLNELMIQPKNRGGCYHPVSKRMVLQGMFEESGVEFLRGAMLFAARTEKGKIIYADFAGRNGEVARIRSSAYIDGTGDGDLCFFAGAEYSLGRQGDGRPQAFSQIGGFHREAQQLASLSHRNFDAGWCDPTDSEDLTRARLLGTLLYLDHTAKDEDRPFMLCPVLGLRQGRLVRTEYDITLDDVLTGARFEDCVGYAGAWIDNHSRDYLLESDEQLFWFHHCLAGDQHTFSEIPYRSLVPIGLKNIFIGSRALGVETDAHNSLRMERDMQRIGEVAGLAASILAGEKLADSRMVKYGKLSAILKKSGALDPEKIGSKRRFGCILADKDFREQLPAADCSRGLESLRSGIRTPEIWALYRNFGMVEKDVKSSLTSSSARESWTAAGICAMKSCQEAEKRLLRAIRSRENGVGKILKTRHYRSSFVKTNWELAIDLLRICGTEKSLGELEKLSREKSLSLRTRISVALTIERLCRRKALSDRVRIEKILDNLLNRPAETGHLCRIQGQEMLGKILSDKTRFGRGVRDFIARNAFESSEWVLHLVDYRIRRIFRPSLKAPGKWLNDPRGYVRRAFISCK